MKKIFLIVSLLIAASCYGHPGIGIVRDSKGNIYYTDLKQVWKLTARGEKTVVVPGVHTHELYIDANDNLFGEHLWYNGEKLNTWGYYAWCLKNDGSLVKTKEPAEGFPSDYGFARDAVGNMYWVERFTLSRFMKKSPDGKIIKLAEGKFGFIGWLYCTEDGTIYFTESDRLQKLTQDGKFAVAADHIRSKVTDFSMMGHQYDGYGIWTDQESNIYIAMIAGKKINRISRDGKIKTIYTSHTLWTPCSGLFDKNGTLWVLENSVTNKVRVRKISKDELNMGMNETKIFSSKTHLGVTFLTGLAIVITLLLLKLVIKKKRLKLQKQTS